MSSQSWTTLDRRGTANQASRVGRGPATGPNVVHTTKSLRTHISPSTSSPLRRLELKTGRTSRGLRLDCIATWARHRSHGVLTQAPKRSTAQHCFAQQSYSRPLSLRPRSSTSIVSIATWSLARRFTPAGLSAAPPRLSPHTPSQTPRSLIEHTTGRHGCCLRKQPYHLHRS